MLSLDPAAWWEVGWMTECLHSVCLLVILFPCNHSSFIRILTFLSRVKSSFPSAQSFSLLYFLCKKVRFEKLPAEYWKQSNQTCVRFPVCTEWHLLFGKVHSTSGIAHSSSTGSLYLLSFLNWNLKPEGKEHSKEEMTGKGNPFGS